MPATPAAPTRTCLSVPGLCCESEARMVRNALEGSTGVSNVDVDVVGRKAWVSHDATVAPNAIVATLAPLGLGALLAPGPAGRSAAPRQPAAAPTAPKDPDDHDHAPGEGEDHGGHDHAKAGKDHGGAAEDHSGHDHAGAGKDHAGEGEDHDGHNHPAPPPGIPWSIVGSGVLVGISLLEGWFPAAEWAALGAIAIGLPPVALKGLRALRQRVMDINFLMTIAIIGALVIGEWSEGSAVVFLFAIAEWLEAKAMDRARSAIAAVMKLAPETATLADGTDVPAASVTIGTRLLVRPGTRVPLDGKVVGGTSAIDESALTGESVPVAKKTGDTVSAGTVNQTGAIEMETTADAGNSAVARMARMVDEAQAARSPSERWVDHFARIYTPVVVVAAVLIAAVPPLLFGQDFHGWFYKALVLLVVACPCALVLSTPVTMVSALARAARQGVLIKGGAHLETLGRLRGIALDKTGTLTEGRFRVVDCVPVGGFDEAELHRMVAAVEAQSSHPLAGAVLEHAKEEGTEIVGASTYETVEGEGVVATVEGRTVTVGNHRMAERLGWHDDEEHARLKTWMDAGRTVIYIGIDGKLAGHMSLADVPRSEAKGAVAGLDALGVRPVILTGDNRGTAEAVARSVGITEVHADLLPGGKVDVLTELRKRHGPIGMVGDGINDGPALAAADIGIAMGARGTAVAMEAADVALMGDDLRRLTWAITLGRAALRRVKVNVGLAIVTKVIVMVLAVIGVANLWLAVAADVGTSLVVIALGLSMLRFPTERKAG